MAKKVGDDEDLDLLMDEIHSIANKPSTLTIQKPINKKENIDMDKEKFQRAITAHNAEIAKIKEHRRAEKRDIKRHQLLKKQAKILYKLSKMKEATQS